MFNPLHFISISVDKCLWSDNLSKQGFPTRTPDRQLILFDLLLVTVPSDTHYIL